MILVLGVNVQPSKHTLGCCTIMSKTKINVFWNYTGAPLENSKIFQKTLPLRQTQTVHCPAKKWTFFGVLARILSSRFNGVLILPRCKINWFPLILWELQTSKLYISSDLLSYVRMYYPLLSLINRFCVCVFCVW